jgi:hypothetical protein
MADDSSLLNTSDMAKDTPGKAKQRKSGKRISELQKRFVSSSEVKAVEPKDVMTRSATLQKVYEHEVKMWLEKQVVASRDF